jgi:O-antigen ligase
LKLIKPTLVLLALLDVLLSFSLFSITQAEAVILLTCCSVIFVFSFLNSPKSFATLFFIAITGAAIWQRGILVALSSFVLGASLGLKRPVNEQLKPKKQDAFVTLLLLPVFFALIKTTALVDLYLIEGVFLNSGLIGVLKYLRSEEHQWLRAILQFLDYALVIGGYFILQKIKYSPSVDRKKILSSSIVGICLGLAVNSIFVFGQVTYLHSIFFRTLNPFFHYVYRFSGSFTDPNAFGVVGALLLPVLIYLSKNNLRALCFIGAVLMIVGELWAGSRTFMLAILLWLLIIGKKYFLSNVNKKLLLGLFSIGVLIVVILGYPPLNEKIQQNISVAGPERILRLLHWTKGIEEFQSRAIFTKIALQSINQYPWTGVGLGRFVLVQERLIHEMKLDLSGWRDNANNFYLQVVAESGLIGLFVLLFIGTVLYQTKFQASKKDKVELSESVFLKHWVWVFLILLVTGPHLFFPEVLITLALVMALFSVADKEVCEDKKSGIKFAKILLGSICVLVLSLGYVASVPTLDSRGFYRKERSENGQVAWFSKSAYLEVCSDEGFGLNIKIATFKPSIEQSPIEIVISYLNSQSVLVKNEINLNNSNWQNIQLTNLAAGRSRINLEASETWTAPGETRNPRALSAQIIWPKEVCDETN